MGQCPCLACDHRASKAPRRLRIPHVVSVPARSELSAVSDRPRTQPPPSSDQATDALQRFLKDIAKFELLTAAQEVELAKRIERGDRGAKQQLIKANLRLVVSIAKRYRNQGMPCST